MSAGLRNSAIISVASAAIVTLLASGAGYAFARMQFRGKNVIFLLIMLMLPLPIWVSLIALFFIMLQLKLVDTLLGLVLIFVTLLLPLSVWMMTTFIRDIPSEIQDAARVDGAGRWRLLYSIILPLARPGMAMLTTWNNFLIPLIFSRSADSQPLTIVLTLFIGQYEVAWEDMSAAAVVTMLPPFPDGALLPALPGARLDHGRGEVRKCDYSGNKCRSGNLNPGRTARPLSSSSKPIASLCGSPSFPAAQASALFSAGSTSHTRAAP